MRAGVRGPRHVRALAIPRGRIVVRRDAGTAWVNRASRSPPTPFVSRPLRWPRPVDRGFRGGSMKLWGGRFADANDARVADFTRSIEIDSALAVDALAGSVAQVHGLGRAGLLTPEEVDD